MTAATIRHAHAPQQHTDPKAQRLAAIRASFGLGTDTIGWTELETADQVAAVHDREGWDTYWAERNADGRPKVAASNACTISWRTDVWEFVKGRARFIHKGRVKVSPSRYITEVWLRNITTGAVVRFVVTHWISGIQPVFKAPEDYRAESLKASIAALKLVLAQGDDPTIVSLDANTTRLPALVKVPGVTWHKTGPTHDVRQIDWVGSRDLAPVQVHQTSIRTQRIQFLDHKATVAAFSLVSADDHHDPEEPMPAVIRTGTDTSGRGIFMTHYMKDWWAAVVSELGFTPTVVQGAWMVKNGGGATESAGYHDGGGCLDLRVWDLTAMQQEAVIRVTRRNGAGSWRRDQRHGMDPHIHLVLGSDEGLSPGAAQQWMAYKNGRDGLKGNGPDYEWRPSPLVTKPPRKDWFDMATKDELRAIVREEMNAALAALPDIKVADPENPKSRLSLARILWRGKRSDDILRADHRKG